jgi:hypothetical protein
MVQEGKCSETTIQSRIERIQQALDKGLHTIGIFLCLTKAYDLLNHKILLEEQYSYEIKGITNSWFQSSVAN